MLNHILRRGVIPGLATLALALGSPPARADITVGFVTSLSGPASSIGLFYARGIKAAIAYRPEVAGEKIKVIQLDDGSDPPPRPLPATRANWSKRTRSTS